MRASASSGQELAAIYSRRFDKEQAYRNAVWKVLVERFFQQYAGVSGRVLDLGCGYGQFINHVRCGAKLAMDLNPAAAGYLSANVEFLQQDCSQPWNVQPASLDLVFTSNFFEHLPSKEALAATIEQVSLALRPGGLLVAMGPNIKYAPGEYWDFWDHHLPLTEASVRELLEIHGFELRRMEARFLPYTMAGKRRQPAAAVVFYLRFPLLWKLFGRQFLIVAAKPSAGSQA